jgi:hypothetical protein
MSLEQKLKERYHEELDNVDDVEELILDGLIKDIGKITPNDKKYLERFKSLSSLSMNFLGLTSIENVPTISTVMNVNYSSLSFV